MDAADDNILTDHALDLDNGSALLEDDQATAAFLTKGEWEALVLSAHSLLEPLRRDFIPIPPLFLWGIAGVEATQATQFFKINNQGSGSGVNNSVPMIARKGLILRVYARSGIIASPAQVTGQVTRPGKPALSPLNGPVAIGSLSNIQRINAAQSLNFRIPAAECVGTVAFTVTVFDSANPANKRTQVITLNFETAPQVRVHGVLIHYTGRGLNIPAPSGIDLLNTLEYLFKTYPINGINYTACEVIDFNGDLTVGGGGGCGTGWNQLFTTLWNMRSASGTNDVFVGLLPLGVPTSGVIGCGGGGVAIAFKNGGAVLAQEVGHAFGRAHAPCGGPGGPDLNYPTYGTYPSGSIGEFGVNTTTLAVFNPASTYDFMSYCGPTWISPYTYMGLKNAIAASPAAAHELRAGGRPKSDEYLFLNFRVHKSGRVELLESFHAHSSNPPQQTGRITDVVCLLVDRAGQTLKSHRCQVVNPHMEDEDEYVDYLEAIPLGSVKVEDIQAIDITQNGKVQTLDVSGAAPVVVMKASKETKETKGHSTLRRIEWELKQPAENNNGYPVHYILRYSADGGQNWQALAAGLTNLSLVVNTDLLPGGDKCLFEVIATAGIHSTSSRTAPVKMARKPRKAYILAPVEKGLTIQQGEEIQLLGGGFSPEAGTTPPEDVQWVSNHDGVLGTGYQVFATLSKGVHSISLEFPDGLGKTVMDHIKVTVR